MVDFLKTIIDEDGVLVPIEFNKLPFEPKRIFYVCDVPKGEERGNHAHYETQQILICLKGMIQVKLHDGFNLSKHLLIADEFIFVDKMIWDSQVFLSGDDILLSICSTSYDKSDYIEDFDQFISLVTKPS